MTNIDKSEKDEKWQLILSKVELPSVKILLSQQAELASFHSNLRPSAPKAYEIFLEIDKKLNLHSIKSSLI